MDWNNRTACMTMKVDSEHAGAVWKRLQEWGPVLGAWETTGDWDYLVWLDVANLDV